MYSHSPWLTEELHALASSQGLDDLHTTVESFWCACDKTFAPPPQGPWRSAFDTAIGEIGANIVRHACAGLPDIQMRLRLRLKPGMVVACFTDLGRIYQPGSVTDTTSQRHSLLDLPEGGMGLAIARAALDELYYRRWHNVNIWRLIKTYPV